MQKELRIIEGWGPYMNRRWEVWYDGTMLLQSSNKKRAIEVYEKYKSNPQLLEKKSILDDIIF